MVDRLIESFCNASVDAEPIAWQAHGKIPFTEGDDRGEDLARMRVGRFSQLNATGTFQRTVIIVILHMNRRGVFARTGIGIFGHNRRSSWAGWTECRDADRFR